MEVTRNEYRANEVSARGSSSIEDKIQEYLQSHDVTFKLPLGSQVTLGARNLDTDEIDLKVKFDDETGRAVTEGTKAPINKIQSLIRLFFQLVNPS